MRVLCCIDEKTYYNRKRMNLIIMESFENTPVQYAYLQPLKILDDNVDYQREEKVDLNDSSNSSNTTEGPALTPIKEEIVPRDLHSYFLDGRGKLFFDEPESLPIIYWVEKVQQPRGRDDDDDDFVVMKMRKKIGKVTKPSARKKFERKVPCDICDRKFVTLRHMKIHAASHLKKREKNKKKSWLTCVVCRRFFSHGGALCLHMRSHKKLPLSTLRKRK